MCVPLPADACGRSQRAVSGFACGRPSDAGAPFAGFRPQFSQTGSTEADEFYAALQRGIDRSGAAAVQRQAFAGMLWSKQFYYFDVRTLAQRRSGPDAAAGRTAAGSECRLAASEQLRRPLDAGHLGISLVRVVGPGLPLRHVGADRSGIRQVAARVADARMVHAPERPVARPTSGPSATSIRRSTRAPPGRSI